MDWKPYFPFDDNTNLDIDGPYNYNGTGRVVEASDAALEFTLNLPAATVFFHHVPGMNIDFRIEAVKEGPGNKATATVNSQEVKDDNVTISSRKEDRLIEFSVPIQGKPLSVTLSKPNKDGSLIVLHHNNKDWEFAAAKKGLFERPWVVIGGGNNDACHQKLRRLRHALDVVHAEVAALSPAARDEVASAITINIDL